MPLSEKPRQPCPAEIRQRQALTGAMTRHALSTEARVACWNRLQALNAQHRRAGTQGPFTATCRAVFAWFLWQAPRRLCIYHSYDQIAEATQVSVSSVKRAIQTLVAWGFLRVSNRLRAVRYPVRVAGRTHLLHQHMRTSNEYELIDPGEADRTGQNRAVWNRLYFKREQLRARVAGGRYASMAVLEKFAQIAREMEGFDPLVEATRQAQARTVFV